jgi:predicted polyphosphate/ATP-dependent NAD kinase
LSTVGIIANPASGKDIRRLVSKSRLIPNQEKINHISRILSGLESTGIKNVLFMPDRSNISRTAAENHKGVINKRFLNMTMLDDQIDTTKAVAEMIKEKVQAIIVLGGDGTSRAAVKAIDNTPLMPLSTGTNNVFPYLIEGTLAGIATGCIALKKLPLKKFAPKHKLLEVKVNSGVADLALVDVAISKQKFIGARAIWDIKSISELFLTFAEPASIGLSAVGGMLSPISRTDQRGLHITLESENPQSYVKAPIIPGEIIDVGILNHKIIRENEIHYIDPKSCTIALDGERSITVQSNDKIQITLKSNGPNVIDPFATLQESSKMGEFSGPLIF